MKPLGYVNLPAHRGAGGFDHAAVHHARGLLYVAHTANHAVDVIDTRTQRYLRSLGDLAGVAGALVDETHDRVFTSNRGEDTIAIVAPEAEDRRARVGVGVRPNGLAFDSGRGVLLSANVGNAEVPGSHTVTLVDVATRTRLADVLVPGRTRWTVFDPVRRVFFVNIAEPALIVVVEPERHAVTARYPMPERGPHGLDLDAARRRLYCACDGGILLAVDADSGAVLESLALSGAPDVIFLDRGLGRLHVASGDPGAIDVIDVATWRVVETVTTERGAHTLALDEQAHRVYAFLPGTHRAAVFEDA